MTSGTLRQAGVCPNSGWSNSCSIFTRWRIGREVYLRLACFRRRSPRVFGRPWAIVAPFLIASRTDPTLGESDSIVVNAFPMVSGMWESLPAVTGRWCSWAKDRARFQVIEWKMLPELTTSTASGIIVRLSGLIADRNRSYG